MKPSNDWPSTRPFFAITPFTVTSRPPTRTFLPTARSARSKSLSATSKPSTPTSRRSLISGSLSGSPASMRVVLHDLVRRRDPEDEHLADGPVRRRPTSLVGVGQPDCSATARASGSVRSITSASSEEMSGRLADRPDLLVLEEPDRDRRPAHLEGVGPDHRAGQVLLDVGVHPLDDRHDDDQEADRDDDAEQSEEGAELGWTRWPGGRGAGPRRGA